MTPWNYIVLGLLLLLLSLGFALVWLTWWTGREDDRDDAREE